MNLIEQRVTALANIVLTNDGHGMAFTLQGERDPIARLRFTLDDMPEFIAHLCLAVAAVHPQPRPSSAPATIAVEGVGLASTDDPTTTQLVVRLSGMDLAFALASTQVAALGRDFQRHAETLSANGPPQ